MNYKVLYRKYRPDAFDSLIGQKHVVEILKNSIKEKKISHAYLFSGPRGTGKTSTARILAKSVNCLNNNNGVACEKCENCLSFNTNPDIIEIDAASNNGVEEIRELINNVKIMPTSLKYKVYIIDEVHMLSQSAFNALLLTLEEPPEHVIFILATTNLESVPITIISRCQRFEFRKISDQEIVERLAYVCDQENIRYENNGLKEIANLSDGGMRDALSILDQLSKSEEVITDEFVNKEIGSVSNRKITDLIESLETNDISRIEEIFKDFININLNYKVVIKKIVYSLSDRSVKKLNGEIKSRLDFDQYKHLIMDLNDLLNKININVDPYLLIKLTFLSYIDVNKESQNTDCLEVKNIENDNNNNNQKLSENMLGNDVDYEEKIKIRLNNCFVNASKKDLQEIREEWRLFQQNVEDVYVKGLINDTVITAASNNYLILVSSISHMDEEINNNLEKIETLLQNYLNRKINLICIDENRWNQEKNTYVKNVRNGYKYKLMDELITPLKEINASTDEYDMANVFDLDKIEIE